MTFETFDLNPALLRALTESSYSQPTQVQQQAIPAAIAGHDLIVSAQTGSGKTAAFLLPSLHQLALIPPLKQDQTTRGRKVQRAQPQMLVLTPTRELALQVTAATAKYSAFMRRMKTVAILGGMPYPKQIQLLARSPDILVATPGRLLDHLNAGRIDASQLQILVLDEADRMLDMGFIDAIEEIVAATPVTRQTLLFSATLDGLVGNIAQHITKNPRIIQIANSTTRHENIAQHVHFVDDLSHKNRLLAYLLQDADINQAIIFTATKRNADIIAERLNTDGFAVAALHGDMSQGARNRTLDSLRRGQVRVLVATDVAARGIDIPGITHVFNYDLPKFPEDYVHRIGRTGRAGRHGIAISLVNHADSIYIKRIEKFTKQAIPVNVVEGYAPKKCAPRHPRKSDNARRKSTDKRRSYAPAGGNDSIRQLIAKSTPTHVRKKTSKLTASSSL